MIIREICGTRRFVSQRQPSILVSYTRTRTRRRISKKTFCYISTLLLRHVPEEQAITDDIPSPHEEVEDCTDGTYMTMDVQLIPMRVSPLLLLRRRHANPEQIRVGSIDGINDSLVVLIAILISHNQGTKAAQVHPAFLNPHLPPCGPSPQNLAQTFDGPPTLERSGSEHRRAVTSSRP